MGVKKLTSWLQASALSKPRFLSADDSRNQEQLVVYDAAGNLRYYLWSTAGLLYDLQEMEQRVREAVDSFRRAGFRLVVFLDATISEERAATWMTRRKGDLVTLNAINSFLGASAGGGRQAAAGTSARKVFAKHWLPPPSSLQNLGHCFQAAGVEVYYSLEDCDREAAQFALRHGAHAVLTCDSDFVMFPGIARVWNCSSMRFFRGGIEVEEVVKAEVAPRLGFANEVALTALAGLLGNDELPEMSKAQANALAARYPGLHIVEAAAASLRDDPRLAASERCRRAVQLYALSCETAAAAGGGGAQQQEQRQQHAGGGAPRNEAAVKAGGNGDREMLLRHAKWLRSVQLEDVSEATPMHALVAPLRAGLYKALGLARVQEHMCMHNTPPEAWRQGEVVDTAGACELRLPAAELEGEVGGWSFQAVAAYIVGLMEEPPPRGLGGVGSTPLQRKALLLQAALREEAQQLVAAYRTRLRQAPSVSDLHAATAFLSVYSLLNILSDAALPPASQVLHVRVYHLLCQNPPLVAQLHQGGTAGASLHWRSRQSRAVSVGGPSACAPPPPAADDPLSPLAGFMSQLSLAAASAAAAAAGDGLSRPPVPAASRSPPSPQQSASQATASLKQS